MYKIRDMKLQTLYKRATTGKLLEHTIEVMGDAYRTHSGYVDGAITTTEWTFCQAKNIGKVNESSPEEQALTEAKAEWKKRTERGYFADAAAVDSGTMFKPMLAHKWEDYADKVQYPMYSQPKLDGIRCIVRSDGMWTRAGKPIISAPHIFEGLKPLFEQNPDLIFDGELYADKYANDFNAIVSLVKKTKPTAQDLKDSAAVIEYHIYDLPSCEEVFTKRYTALQHMQLHSWTTPVQLPLCCVLVDTNYVECAKDVETFYSEYVAAGYEGQMLRLDLPYENKRSKSLMKHKSFTDEEYTIVGYEEGNGNLTGMVGALVFETVDGDRFTASVNGGWDHLKELWAERDTLIGQQATVKYFQITPDGKPRFPKVTAIRNYE
jgi:DNA ligase-1